MIAGSSAALILILLALLHFYWAAGGRIGRDSAIPTTSPGRPILRPGPWGTAAVGLTLLAMAALLGVEAGWFTPPGPPWGSRLTHGGAWLTAGLFALRAIGDFRYVGVGKRIRDTRFARLDTLIYSPLCALLALLIAVAAAR